MEAPEGALHIIRTLQARGHQALLAGGCVRDRLMGRTPGDWDIATGAPPEEVVRLFERTTAVGIQFGVVRVLAGDGEYEVARFREDDIYIDGRRPESVRFAGAREDALRRDLTINGMFCDPLTGEVLDYVGGREDIAARRIRAIGEAGARFREDHLRMLRAVRFAALLDFEIEKDTFAAIRANAPLIRKTSAPRVREELTRMLTGPRAGAAFQLLLDAGLLGEILPEAAAMDGVLQPPEFHPEGDVWTHVRLMLDRMEAPTPSLAWGVLLHDVGKPPTFQRADRIRFNGHAKAGTKMTEDICARLQMSNEDAQRIRDLVAHHMRFLHVRQMRESRLKRFLREPFMPDLLELHRLDCLVSHGGLRTNNFCREKLAELEAEGLTPARLLDGEGLIAMGFSPGPLFAEILEAVEDEQLEGRVQTREEAEAFVRRRFGAGAGGGD
ncbi:MAG: HD domain-containing protein [bacterium]